MIDVDAVRADTPACAELIHFNNAGASLMPDPVYSTLLEHLGLERRIGGYEAASRAAAALAGFYDEFAQLLNVGASEIAYVENATRAWDMAFYALRLGRGDRVLAHESEYVSNYLAILQQAQRRGFEVDLVPSDATGQIDVEALDGMITPATRLVALTHVPTQGGLINPAAAVGKIARRNGLVYLLDACQSVGQIDLDVSKIGCHILSGTGRKFLRGPRGTGFLYVSNDLVGTLDPPFVDLHSASWNRPDGFEFVGGARRFENWESFVAGRIALARAVRYARDLGIAAIERRVTTLAARLRSEVSAIPGCEVRDLGAAKCGIVTFTLTGVPPSVVQTELRRRNINVSTTSMESARMDFERRGIDGLVRASVHYFNTEEEIADFVAALGQLAPAD
jgi:selenocysteine lyase/cysteine desulfurase